MRKFLKISLIIFLSIFIIFAVLISAYFIITKDAKLDSNKLIGAGQNITIFDGDGNEITSAEKKRFNRKPKQRYHKRIHCFRGQNVFQAPRIKLQKND